MTSPLDLTAIASEFAADGAACLRQGISQEWVSILRNSVDERLRLSERLFDHEYNGEPGHFYVEQQVRSANADVGTAIFRSGIAAKVGVVMGATRTRIFDENILVKEPLTSAVTKWHHDIIAWPLHGQQICTAWIALDEVDAANGGLIYVRQSHRIALSEVEEYVSALDSPATVAKQLASSITATNHPTYRSWRLEPGDVLIHHAHTVHGAGGNQTSVRRRALATRWCGDDARIGSADAVSRLLGVDAETAKGVAVEDISTLVWESSLS